MAAGLFLKGIISKGNFTYQSFLKVALLLWASQIVRNHSSFPLTGFVLVHFTFLLVTLQARNCCRYLEIFIPHTNILGL